MQNGSNRPFSPTNASQRPGGILPPLSKYYYGPAVSPDRSPVNGEAFARNSWSAQDPPALQPRLPPSPAPAPAPAPFLSHSSPHLKEPVQHSKLPGPPPTTPLGHPIAQSSYNSHNYHLLPGARSAPIETSWDQSSYPIASLDTSTWGHSPVAGERSQSPDGIASFEYLRPVAYSPASSPSNTQASPLPAHGDPEQASSQIGPRQLPPPPPPKIPADNGNHQAQSVDGLSEHRNKLWAEEVNGILHQNHRPSHHADLRHAATTQVLDSSLNQTCQEPVEQQSQQDRSISDHKAKSSHVHSEPSSRLDEVSLTISKPAFDSTIGVFPTQSNQSSRFNYETNDQSESPVIDQGFGTPKDVIQANVRESSNSGLSRAAVATNGRAQHEEMHNEALGAQERIVTSGDLRSLANNQGQAQGGGDSFYWHSPHSTASISHDHDQDQDILGASSLLDATPEPKEEQTSASPKDREPERPIDRTTGLYQSILGPYSASALGFGGPSDWEHFGDYEAEEVDDTDLYIRPRSLENPKASIDTSELPADSALERQPSVINGSTENEDRASNQNLGEPQVAASDRPVETSDLASEQDDRKSREPGEGDHPVLLTSASQSSLALDQAHSLRDVDAPSAPSQLPVIQNLIQEPELVEQPASNAAVLPANAVIANQSADTIPSHADEALGAKIDCEFGNTVNRYTDPHKIEAEPLSRQRDLDTPERLGSQPVSSPPLSSEQPQHQGVVHIPETQTSSRRASSERASFVSNGSILLKTQEQRDPYGDLDPWARSSLNRYVSMLREESRGATDAEKLSIFQAFSQKELKLRAVLYNRGNDQGDTLSGASNDGPSQGPSSLALRRPASKALPALPPDADHSERVGLQNAALISPNMQKMSPARLEKTREDKKSTQPSGEDDYTLVGTPASQKQQLVEEAMVESYSPGGRPMPASAPDDQKKVFRPVSEPGVSDAARQNPKVLTDHDTERKSAYIPFRYSQGLVDDSDQPISRRASYRPYAALKLELVEDRAEPISLDSSVSGHRASLTTKNGHVSPRPVIAQEHHPSDPEMQRSIAADQKPLVELRRFERADFDPLVAVLPSSDQIPHSAVELISYQRGVDAVPDDFSFIHQHVVAWDAKAKVIRGQHDKERHARQAESEQRIDALFNDDEIGYGDIAELESEFKRAEAARKTEEDRAEYQAFVTEVFDVVWTRLHYEIDQLGTLYDEYTGLAHETLAGRDMFETTSEGFALAPTMNALLTLHQKLEMRHQKAFEAVLERDRKLKKTEISPWYSLANVAKVKQLEQQFEHAERKAIVEYCKQRDRRANRLMDVLDQNTLRGVGANQDYMEAVMKAVRRIASGRASASAPASEPGLGMDEVIKAKTVTAALASSSEQIVQTFHVADMLLNAADYELSVATSKLANADATMFERLREERASEETKLMRDLQHRLALIREDSRRTNDEIVKLLCFLGVQGGHAQASSTIPGRVMGNVNSSPDTSHEQRLQKALEDAKRRNIQVQKGAGDDMG
ncbi:MAG: hypothetical protein Q9174_004342 [Haloplaca sp. 1 TL-2023]